jgi:microcystin-dependent protein
MLGSLKEWMDAVMTSIQEIKGTTYWYGQSGSGSLESIRQDLGNTLITGRGHIKHSLATAGRINWDQDIQVRVVGSRLSYKILANAATTDITLTDDKVAYLTLVRGVEILPQLIWTNSSATITSVGAIAWTSPLQAGDWIKVGAETDAAYYQIQSVESTTQVTLTEVFTGTSTGAGGAKSKYSYGVYQTDAAPSTNRHIHIANRKDTPSGENVFWMMVRSDNGGGTARCYIRFLGQELQQGEEVEISDTTSSQLFTFIGSNGDADDSPQYTSNNYVIDGTSLVAAASALDLRLGTVSGIVNQDRNIKLIEGGHVSWDLATETLTFESDAYVNFPSISKDRNTIAAGNYVVTPSGNFLYITLNRTAGAPATPATTVGNPANADGIFVIARRIGNYILIGDTLLRDKQSVLLNSVTNTDLQNTKYVAKNGINSTADGSIDKPFLTIQAALTSITDNSPTNPYVVLVSPGDYSADGSITMKDSVALIGRLEDVSFVGDIDCAAGNSFIEKIYSLGDITNVGSGVYNSLKRVYCTNMTVTGGQYNYLQDTSQLSGNLTLSGSLTVLNLWNTEVQGTTSIANSTQLLSKWNKLNSLTTAIGGSGSIQFCSVNSITNAGTIDIDVGSLGTLGGAPTNTGTINKRSNSSDLSDGASLVKLTATQVLINKDLDGGTASNTSRITVPKGTLAAITALTRKEGTILYATDTDRFYSDDGATLNELALAGTTTPAGASLSWRGTSGTPPTGWLFEDGSELLKTSYASLYAEIGDTYGDVGLGHVAPSDGFHFRLPDSRGRSDIGSGTGSGLSARTVGQQGGEETHTLSIGELPAHDHGGGDHTHWNGARPIDVNAVSDINNGTSTLVFRRATGVAASGAIITSQGSGTAHNVMHPFLVAQKIIKY